MFKHLTISALLGTLLITACGRDHSARRVVDGPIDPTLQGQVPAPSPGGKPAAVKTIKLEIGAAADSQGLSFGPVSLIPTPIESQQIGFSVTNTGKAVRCFLQFQFAVNQEAQDKRNYTFVSGSVMRVSTFATTNTCLRPQETGYVLTFIEHRDSEVTRLVLTEVESSPQSKDFVSIQQLSVASIAVEDFKLEVTYKNEGIQKPFYPGFQGWVAVSGGIVQDWGFLYSEDSNLPLHVPVGETFKMESYYDGSVPLSDIHILIAGASEESE